MASISVSTGRKEIDIVRDGEKVGVIYFSPSDTSIISRLNEARRRIEDAKPTISEDAPIEDIIAEMNRIDSVVRESIDYAFGYPVSDVVFGQGFSFTTTDGVSTVEQFLNGAMGYISAALEEENGKAKARQDKYLKKYRK